MQTKEITISKSGASRVAWHHFLTRLKSGQLAQNLARVKRAIEARRHRKSAVSPRPNTGDLIIVYRHVYIGKDSKRFPEKARPSSFSYENCLKNLLNSIKKAEKSYPVKLIILYNGSENNFQEDLFGSIIENFGLDFNIYFLNAQSAVESVLTMLEFLKSSDFREEDIIYILENDYLHHVNWIEEVFELFRSEIDFDYASLYDHPDRYNLLYGYDMSRLFVTKSRHWITAPSTCGSFMMRASVLKRDFRYLYSTRADRHMFANLIGKKGRRLLTPVPGLAVHCMQDYPDPVQSFD